MELSWESVAVGFRFIWRRETILGAMLFEFMASLFGSVNALLRSSARHPRRRRLGRRPVAQRDRARRLAGRRRAHPRADPSAGGLWLFATFALLAVATIAFGFSTSLVFSIVALMAVGVGTSSRR